MKLTPSSTAGRRTASAEAGSFGGPQIPSPVIRIAPKPIRRTVSSPPSETVLAEPANRFPLFLFMFVLQNKSSDYEMTPNPNQVRFANRVHPLTCWLNIDITLEQKTEGWRDSYEPALASQMLRPNRYYALFKENLLWRVIAALYSLGPAKLRYKESRVPSS